MKKNKENKQTSTDKQTTANIKRYVDVLDQIQAEIAVRLRGGDVDVVVLPQYAELVFKQFFIDQNEEKQRRVGGV